MSVNGQSPNDGAGTFQESNGFVGELASVGRVERCNSRREVHNEIMLISLGVHSFSVVFTEKHVTKKYGVYGGTYGLRRSCEVIYRSTNRSILSHVQQA